MGQGKTKAKAYLVTNPTAADELEARIRQHFLEPREDGTLEPLQVEAVDTETVENIMKTDEDSNHDVPK